MLRFLPRHILLLSAAFLLAGEAGAQYFRQSSYWKTHRTEVEFGFGISNFLGELGGRNQIGSPFVWDLEFSQTRPAASLAYRYYLARQQALRLRFTYGILAGNDNLTTEPFRQNRNLSFKSDVFELSLVYELHLYREELGHIYDLRGVKGTKSSRVGLYLFGGVGGFYFDPRAQYNNAWVRLKPMRTEGQGLPGGPDEYKNFQVCIPLGFGIRRAFTKNWSGGLELQYTKTFTDYVDDVSTSYYYGPDPLDAQDVNIPEDEVAGYLADPSLGLMPGQTARGQQRGDEKDLDAYLFLKFTADWKIYKYKSGSKKYRARIRRAKIVF
ncbi:MAG: hypothetical protein IPK70_02810 [Flavobacteriales bacterium]|nr:hypothetical protein [Flavobacteriales bacterium]